MILNDTAFPFFATALIVLLFGPGRYSVDAALAATESIAKGKADFALLAIGVIVALISNSLPTGAHFGPVNLWILSDVFGASCIVIWMILIIFRRMIWREKRTSVSNIPRY